MDHSLDKLRRAAKRLRKSHQTGEEGARQRLQRHLPKQGGTSLQHADYLHVIAQENGFTSWPQLKLAVEVSGIPALHQAVRQFRVGDTVRLLLEAGMDPMQTYQGMTAYAIARAFGNSEAAQEIASAGGKTALNETETIFANAAEGHAQDGIYLDVAKLPELLRGIIADLLPFPDKLEHIKRLVALGIEYDYVSHAITPLHSAGWLGDPVALAYLVSLSPDMGFINGYGGTLLSSIVHGSENSPPRVGGDHIACARLALDYGVALPKWVIDMAGDEAMLVFLQDWATAHPGQLTEG